jgi:hypothetical protein
MGRHSNSLTPIQAACLLALRAQPRNLEKTVASLLQLAIAQPEGPLRDRLVDKVSSLDSIADVMRKALDAMDECGTGQSGLRGRPC